jgi:non-ribosomal peptide synthetase component F
LNNAQTFIETLLQVKQTVIRAYEFQSCPFLDIVDGEKFYRGERHPLVDVVFFVPDRQALFGTALALDGIAITRLPQAPQCSYAKFDYNIMALVLTLAP